MPPTAARQPAPLQRLLDKLQASIRTTTGKLADGDIDTDAWRAAMAQELTRYHAAAAMAGSKQRTPDEAMRATVAKTVKAQLSFLSDFAIEIQDSKEFEKGWMARAEMYAGSITEPYWRGRTKVLPLPAMPSEGTQCLTRCKCLWSIETVNEEAGDYNAYWIRNSSDGCQTCVQRASEWSPLRIRGGELM